jgi:hypothetical protein
MRIIQFVLVVMLMVATLATCSARGDNTVIDDTAADAPDFPMGCGCGKLTDRELDEKLDTLAFQLQLLLLEMALVEKTTDTLYEQLRPFFEHNTKNSAPAVGKDSAFFDTFVSHVSWSVATVFKAVFSLIIICLWAAMFCGLCYVIFAIATINV